MTHDIGPGLPGGPGRADSQSRPDILLDAGHSSRLVVPGGNFLLEADYHRHGADLVLTGKDGHQVVVQHFFSAEHPPELATPFGGVIAPDLAVRLAGPEAPGQYAANGGAGAQLKPIGVIDKLSGHVTVHHTDGTTETLAKGGTVFQGDVLETGDDGSVGIVFQDRTVFSLGAHGRMVLDELVYDADSHSGHESFSVVQGAFSFVSGQIAKSSPDAMSVRTPVMTIGIRGTTVAGTASAEGEQNTVALLQDGDGGVGQIVISNSAGTMVLTQANQTLELTSSIQPIPSPAVLTPEQVQQIFGEAVASRPSQPSQDPVIPGAQSTPSSNQGGTNGTPSQTGSVDLGGQDQVHPKDAEGHDATAAQAATTAAGSTLVSTSTTTTTTTTEGGSQTASSSGQSTGASSTSTTSIIPTVVLPSKQEGSEAAAVETTGVFLVASATQSVLTGTVNGDTLEGWSGGAATIIGDGGADTIVGGTGGTAYTDVIYAGGSTTDLSSVSAANLTYAGDSSVMTVALETGGNSGSVTGGADVNNAIFYGIHSFTGSASGANTLTYAAEESTALTVDLVAGTAVHDGYTDHFANFQIVVGTASDDLFYGGTGGHTLEGGGGADVLSYAKVASDVTVTLDGSGQGTVTAASSEVFDGFASIVGGSGNDRFLAGDTGGFTLGGGAGVDTLSFESVTGSGGVVLDVAAGTVELVDSGERDAFSGFELVVGSHSDDTFLGGSASNVTMAGGGGVDWIDYSGAASAVLVDLATGSGGKAARYDHYLGIENVIGSDFGDTLIGDAAANSIIGGAGNDTIEGGSGGGDTLDGGDGIDTLSFTDATGSVVIDVGNQTAVLADGSTDIFVDFTWLTGSGQDDTFLADKSDLPGLYLVGGAGRDTLELGDPDGLADSDFAGMSGIEVVTVAPSGSETYELGNTSGMAGVADLKVDASTSDISILVDASGRNQGQSLTVDFASSVNLATILGGRGADVIDVTRVGDALVLASAGNDTVSVDLANSFTAWGGAGSDTLAVSDSSGGALSFTLSAGVVDEIASVGGSALATAFAYGFENLVYEGSDDVTAQVGAASKGAHTIVTGSGSDTLTGGDGNNYLDGGTGGNTLIGGTVGTDTFVGHAGAADVIENFASGTDRLLVDFGSVSGTFDVDGALSFSGGTGTSGTGVGASWDGNSFSATVASGTTIGLSDIDSELTVGSGSTVTGGAGNDTFTVAAGATGISINGGTGGTDTLAVTGTASQSLTVDLSSGKLFGTSGTIFNVQNVMAAAMVFAAPTDGLVLTGSTLGSTLVGSSNGSDTLIGESGHDRLESVSGHDVMKASDASTFVLNTTSSAHSDTIIHTGTETGTIDVSGIDGDALLGFKRSGDDLVALIGGEGGASLDSSGALTGGTVTVQDYFASGAAELVGMHSSTEMALFVQGTVGPSDSLYNDLIMVGTSGDDLIWSGSNGTLHTDFYGGGGNDIIVGHGDDTAYFRLYTNTDQRGMTFDLEMGVAGWLGSSQTHLLISVDGIDGIVGTAYDDTFIGGSANKGYWFDGYKGNNTIEGGSGDGWVVADYSSDPAGISADLSTGNTLVNGYGGTDTLIDVSSIEGTSQADTMKAPASGLWFQGNAGNDTLDGTAAGTSAVVTMSYQDDPGAVTVNLDTAAHSVALVESGVTGYLTVAAGTGVDGWGGIDTLINVNGVIGSDYADVLFANSIHASTLDGGLGNDTLVGGVSNGLNLTWADYSQDDRTAGITADIAAGTVVGGDGDTDTLVDINAIIGTSHADTVISSDGHVDFVGNGGDDVLEISGAAHVNNGNTSIDGVFVIDASGASAGGTINLDSGSFSGMTVIGSSHGDKIYGGTENTIIAGDGSNTIHGGAGDLIRTGSGTNLVYAVGGETIDASSGTNVIHLDDGIQTTIDYSSLTASGLTVTVGSWIDVDKGTATDEILFGSSSTADLFGTNQGDSVTGSSDDILVYHDRADAWNNAITDALVSYDRMTDGVTVDLSSLNGVDLNSTGGSFSVIHGTGVDTITLGQAFFWQAEETLELTAVTGSAENDIFKADDPGELTQYLFLDGGDGIDTLAYDGTATLEQNAFSYLRDFEVLSFDNTAALLDLSTSGYWGFAASGISTVELGGTSTADIRLGHLTTDLTVVTGDGDALITGSDSAGLTVLSGGGNDTVTYSFDGVIDYSTLGSGITATVDGGGTTVTVDKAGGKADTLQADGVRLDIIGTGDGDTIDAKGYGDYVYHPLAGTGNSITDALVSYDRMSGGATFDLAALGYDSLSNNIHGTYSVVHGGGTDTVTLSSAWGGVLDVAGSSGDDVFNLASVTELQRMTIDGGDGNDVVNLASGGTLYLSDPTGAVVGVESVVCDLGGSSAAVGVDLSKLQYDASLTGVTLTGGSGDDVLAGVIAASGLSVANTLDGGMGTNTLIGGYDTQSGSSGADMIIAHAGSTDVLENVDLSVSHIDLGDITLSTGDFMLVDQGASPLSVAGNYTDTDASAVSFSYGSGSDFVVDLSDSSDVRPGDLGSCLTFTIHLTGTDQVVYAGNADATVDNITAGDTVISGSGDDTYRWVNPGSGESIYLESADPASLYSGNGGSDTLILSGTEAGSDHLTFDLSAGMLGSEGETSVLVDGTTVSLLTGVSSELVNGANAELYGFHNLDASSLTSASGAGLYVYASNADTLDMTVEGTQYADTLVGGGGNNTLSGGAGGGDTLIGGTHGGETTENDNVFVLEAGATASLDTILNFDTTRDYLVLEGVTAEISNVVTATTTSALASASDLNTVAENQNAVILIGDAQNNTEVWVHHSDNTSYQVAVLTGTSGVESSHVVSSTAQAHDNP